MPGPSGVRKGAQKYSDIWNAEEALRRINALEAKQHLTGTVLPVAGTFFSQNFFLDPPGEWYIWNGTTWNKFYP